MNQGVNHNIPILRDIISQPRFVSGDITTNFISEVYPQGFKGQLYTVHAQYLRSSKSERLIGEGLLYYKRCGFCTMLVWMLTVLTLYLYREGYE